MKVFYFFSVLGEYFYRLSRELHDGHGVSHFSGMLYGRDHAHDLWQTGFPWRNVWVFTEYFTRRNSLEPDLAYLARCEREYGPPNLQLLIAGDRFLSGFSHNRALTLLEAAFRFCEEALDHDRPDVIVSESVSCTLSYALYLVARRRRIPFLSIVHARISGRVAIVRNPYDRFEKVEDAYARLKQRRLSDSEREAAQEFLTRFRKSKIRPDYMRPEYELRLGGRHDIAALSDMFRRRRRDPDNYLVTHPMLAIWNRVVRNVRFQANRGVFESPVPGEKFVVFPLHFQPEASTLIRAPFCLDQLGVIENIAKSVPIDHRLYVKEHSVSAGKRPLSFYKRIKQLANVRLISPYVDSHEILQQASAVLCITGTMGWEAVLYERPVITFGDACYNAFDLVERAGDIRHLPNVLANAIARSRTDHELLLKFVTAMFLGTYEGYRPSTDTYVLNDENARKIARALITELEDAAVPVAGRA